MLSFRGIRRLAYFAVLCLSAITAEAQPTFSISGQVFLGSTKLPGVIVSDGIRSATTVYLGRYIILGIPNNSDEYLSATLAGYIINPDFANPLHIHGNNLIGKNFFADPIESPSSSSQGLSSFGASSSQSSANSIASSLSSSSQAHSAQSSSSSSPGTLNPILNCVEDNLDGTYTAHFGYSNQTGLPIELALGANNYFFPFPQDRGQPIHFEMGVVANVFEVIFDGLEMTWHLNSKSATASALSRPCDLRPVCAAGGPYNLECQGETTLVQLNSSGSLDPLSGQLQYFWQFDCPNATLDDPSSANPTLFLWDPGLYLAANCRVFLEVTNPAGVNSCSAEVNVAACSDSCAGGAKVDRCGVCGGDGMSCFDCTKTDLSTQLKALSLLSHRQNKAAQRAVRKLQSLSSSQPALKTFSEKSSAKLVLQSTRLTRHFVTLPQAAYECSDRLRCQAVDLKPAVKQILKAFRKIAQIGSQAMLANNSLSSKVKQRTVARFSKMVQEAARLMREIPSSTSECR